MDKRQKVAMLLASATVVTALACGLVIADNGSEVEIAEGDPKCSLVFNENSTTDWIYDADDVPVETWMQSSVTRLYTDELLEVCDPGSLVKLNANESIYNKNEDWTKEKGYGSTLKGLVSLAIKATGEYKLYTAVDLNYDYNLFGTYTDSKAVTFETLETAPRFFKITANNDVVIESIKVGATEVYSDNYKLPDGRYSGSLSGTDNINLGGGFDFQDLPTNITDGVLSTYDYAFDMDAWEASYKSIKLNYVKDTSVEIDSATVQCAEYIAENPNSSKDGVAKRYYVYIDGAKRLNVYGDFTLTDEGYYATYVGLRLADSIAIINGVNKVTAPIDLKVGETVNLTVGVSPSACTSKVTWTPKTPINVNVKLTNNGRSIAITGKSAGTQKLTATVDGKTASVTINVKAAEVSNNVFPEALAGTCWNFYYPEDTSISFNILFASDGSFELQSGDETYAISGTYNLIEVQENGAKLIYEDAYGNGYEFAYNADESTLTITNDINGFYVNAEGEYLY